MRIDTSLSFEFDSSESATIFYACFMPEFSSLPMKRSTLILDSPQDDSAIIRVRIEAEDATAYRATINSLVQFAHIVEKTLAIASSP